MSEDRSVTVLLSVGLFTLGLLIGTLVAMSAHSLAQGVLASLFALFGGSLLGLLQKVPVQDQCKRRFCTVLTSGREYGMQ
jgi:ABC-type transport system involved in multi-copper enzyme maturation permease subunit